MNETFKITLQRNGGTYSSAEFLMTEAINYVTALEHFNTNLKAQLVV